MTVTEFLMCFAAGLIASIINTLAGSGSVVTLTLLSFLGLPSTVANGTNRIGVVVQSCIAYFTFKKNAIEPIVFPKSFIVAALLGALLGSWMAVEINEQLFNACLSFIMVILFVLVLMKPKAWLKTKPETDASNSPWLLYPAYFAIGVYGGFVQAGVGVLLLSVLVVLSGLHLQIANPIKILIVLCFSIPVLFIFVSSNLVNWEYGISMAMGQSIGAYFAAIFASKVPQANFYIRYLLLAIIIMAAVRFFLAANLL